MFMGSVPDPMRRMIHEHALGWTKDGDVYIGCSGNLTIERTLAPLGFRLHSNDVNAYSVGIGWHFAGQPVPYRLREDSKTVLGWLEPYLDDGPSTVATLMLGTRFLQSVGKDNIFHQRQVRAHIAQWEKLHAKTLARVTGAKLRLASFAAEDVVPWAESLPDDSPLTLFPPFFSGDYSQMFAAIDKHFQWPEPSFMELDDAQKDRLVATVTDRQHWLIGLHEPHAELKPFHRGLALTTNRGTPIYLYGSGGPTRLVMPHQEVVRIGMPKIGPDDDLGDRMRLHPLSGPQFAQLRSMWMSKTIKPGSPLLALGVSVDGLLIGALAFLPPPSYNPHLAYLMSDFPVPWTRYRRLSKLIVMAGLTSEARHLVQRMLSISIRSVGTTAYSDNPNSAKYGRGVPGMHLTKRTQPSGDGIHEFQLQYEAPAGQWTCDEALRIWKQKHGKATAE